MQLYEEILIKALEEGAFSELVPEGSPLIAEIVEGTCYRALQRIKSIIEDEELSDAECFLKIEEIVSALEEIGSGGGTRHDFG